MKRETREYLRDGWDFVKVLLPILLFLAIIGIAGRHETFKHEEPTATFLQTILNITDSAGWGHPTEEGVDYGE